MGKQIVDFEELSQPVSIELRIGRRIKAIRALRGMSALQLAEATGMSSQTISHLENGKTDFKLSTIKAIEEVLHCTLLLIPNEDLT